MKSPKLIVGQYQINPEINIPEEIIEREISHQISLEIMKNVKDFIEIERLPSGNLNYRIEILIKPRN